MRGGASAATVYQMPTRSFEDVINGTKQLAEMGVNIINYSAGYSFDGSYSSWDKELDEMLEINGIVWVNAAGNEGLNEGYVAAPAMALNCIAVGNVITKTDGSTKMTGLFSMDNFSSYKESPYLPNKPDISAPGARITTPYVTGEKSGTSFAAPVVTSIIAQMMSENSRLKGNPLAVKAALLLGADHSKLDVTNDTWKNTGIRNKSGAGLIDAKYALNRITYSTKINIDLNTTSESERYYFEAGTQVKAVMVFDKKNDILITQQSDLDDLDFEFRKGSTGVNYATSQSSVNNVEIIDTYITESGYYYFNVKSFRIADSKYIPDVAIAFHIYE